MGENRMKILEVCVDSTVSAEAAMRGGADRLELCGNLVIGGTTPSPALFQAVREAVRIPVRVMIRPRFGDFLYAEDEILVMAEEIRQFRALGADGIVLGALTPEGNLDIPHLESLLRAADGMSATLHRAFDMCRDPLQALENAVSLGFDTVLSSGQAENCPDGADLLRELNGRAAGRIDVMAGAGLTAEAIPALHEMTGITSFHLSGKKRVPSGMLYRNPAVHMGLPGLSEYERDVCDEEKIRAAASALRRLSLFN